MVEDYVKTIYQHTEWQDAPITTSALAARLGLAASTVTEMVKKLVVQGLVTHVPYGAVTLTEAGTTLAVGMLRKHRLIETWLVEHYGYTWDEVHDEAEVLEHALSDRLLEAIDDRLGHPVRDPHGDVIPGADGSVVRPVAVVLGAVADGGTVRVVRISDRDPRLLRHLAAEGIVLDARVRIVGRKPFSGAIALEVGIERHPVDLGEDAAGFIWVVPGV